MSREVETSRGTTQSNATGFLDFARNDRLDDRTQCLFSLLEVYHDVAAHSAATNMAIDEALLGSATVPSIRFYKWQSPALSFGYFGRFADVAGYARERDLVRRWTGGGIVFHGNDLTYSIVIPVNDAVFGESSIWIYEKVHRALTNALVEAGQRATVAGVADLGSGINAAGYKGHCFANAVRDDVMIDGRKIAGAAQRRTRGGLLHQGSIQYIDLANALADRFVYALSANCRERELKAEILHGARDLAQCKYGSDAWLRKR